MVLQVMDDRWESEIIEFGAINITGFRIVDTNRRLVREFYDSWKRLDPQMSVGAGRESISVSSPYYIYPNEASSLVWQLNICVDLMFVRGRTLCCSNCSIVCGALSLLSALFALVFVRSVCVACRQILVLLFTLVF